MCRFIDRHLRPGGLVYLSYNAMPGGRLSYPFNACCWRSAGDCREDSGARFSAAVRLVHKLAAVGAPSLAARAVASKLDGIEAGYPIAYLAHEYMGTNWLPLFVTEVREAMAAIGLVPAGSATLIDNFNSFALRRGHREALVFFEDPETRGLARDFLMDQRFRRDVYSRGSQMLDDEERRDRLFTTRYALVRPAEKVGYGISVPWAGQLVRQHRCPTHRCEPRRRPTASFGHGCGRHRGAGSSREPHRA